MVSWMERDHLICWSRAARCKAPRLQNQLRVSNTRADSLLTRHTHTPSVIVEISQCAYVIRIDISTTIIASDLQTEVEIRVERPWEISVLTQPCAQPELEMP